MKEPSAHPHMFPQARTGYLVRPRSVAGTGPAFLSVQCLDWFWSGLLSLLLLPSSSTALLSAWQPYRARLSTYLDVIPSAQLIHLLLFRLGRDKALVVVNGAVLQDLVDGLSTLQEVGFVGVMFSPYIVCL